jgi:hypothetical protein
MCLRLEFDLEIISQDWRSSDKRLLNVYRNSVHIKL